MFSIDRYAILFLTPLLFAECKRQRDPLANGAGYESAERFISNERRERDSAPGAIH